MRHLALLAVATLAAATLSAQTRRPMTFADLQSLHRIADPQISPSGKWVLFSVTDADLAKNTKTNHLWAVPLNGGPATPAQEHLLSDAPLTNGRFSPDGKWVMYTSTQSGTSQIWIAAWNDNTGALAPGAQMTSLETEADGAIWAPDSKHFLFTSAVYPECEAKTEGAGGFSPLNQPNPNAGFSPGETKRAEAEANCNALKDTLAANSPVKAQIFTELLYRHWNTYIGPKHSHIFWASIAGAHEVPLDLTPASVIGDHEAPTFSLGGPLGYAISPDGREIAYVTNLDPVPAESTNNDIFTLTVGADPHTAKKVSASPGSDDGPQYSPDGKYLAWRSQARNGYESDKFRLFVMKRADGTTRDLTDHFDGWVDEFTWGPKSDKIFFASAMTGEEAIFQTSDIEGKLAHEIAGIVQSGEFGSVVISPDDQTLVASGMKVSVPSTIVSMSVHVPDEKLSFLSHLNDSLLAQLNLPAMESFWFPGANNTKVQGFLIKPPNFDPSKKYPLKFLIHGGPQGAWGDAWSYRWNPELFAADGYVVVMINPRGSTGYGQKFLEQVSGDWGGRPYIDLMKGLDFAEAKYPFIDKTRECALGASYGGFMADYILTHTNRFACIVTHDGMYNPQSAFGTTEELWFNEWEFRPLKPAGGPSFPASSERVGSHKAGPAPAPEAVVEQTTLAHPWDFYNLPAAQDPFRKFSPMLSIKNAKTPTLVIHGQRDYRLDVSEGLQLFTALQLLHVPSKMLYFPDEGHWVLKPQNSQLWYQTVNDWCDQWTHTNAYAK